MFGRHAALTELDNYVGPFTTNQVISDGDVDVIGVDTSGSTVTITLGTDVAEEGRTVVVKDVGGAAGTNAITVDTEGTETIDGGNSGSIASNYGAVVVVCDGNNWWGVGAVSGGVL